MTSFDAGANLPEESLFPDPATSGASVAGSEGVVLLAPAAPDRVSDGRGSSRRPGRPLEMSPGDVLGTIRELSANKDGLFRVHLSAPGLYARARRLFGSWSAAVRNAGLDYESLQGVARARSLQTRRRNRRRGLTSEPRALHGAARR